MSEAPREDLVRSAPFALERADGDDGLTLTGHGAVFNEWTTIDSWEGRFKERIAPGAFKRSLRNYGSRVRLQFDHGQHPLIGSLPIGSIRKLEEDSRGLFVEARLADNWLVQPVREAIESGSIDGMSFRFAVVDERWEKQDTDLPERTITEVRLMELGPVVWPAYDGTDVGVRALVRSSGRPGDVEMVRALLAADNATRRAVADVLSVAPDPLWFPPASDEPADHGTSEDATSQDGPPDAGTRSEHDGPPDEGHLSLPHKPAQLPSLTRDRLNADLARVTAAVAAGSARSA
jgi:HK97 family phage prohead protease